jgi:hypothetical protein
MFGLGSGIFMKGLLTNYITPCIISIFGTVKVYVSASYLFIKPVVVYSCMRFTWLLGIAGFEWWSGRLYSINCIGEGFNGFYNHIFQLASPVCTGLLTTHIGLMGVLVASFVITCIWGLYNILNQIKGINPVKNIMSEYNDIKKTVVN